MNRKFKVFNYACNYQKHLKKAIKNNITSELTCKCKKFKEKQKLKFNNSQL